MSDDSRRSLESPDERLERMEWGEIREPGSYLHIASGLIARIYAEDVGNIGAQRQSGGGGTVVRLVPNPSASMSMLRDIAGRHGLRVNS